MAANKEFNFKHKKPFETKTTNSKEPGNADHPINTVVTEETPEEQKEIRYIKEPIIKPKAEPRNKRVQLLLTESNHLKIKEYAINSGTSVNDAINQIIENL